MSENEISPEQAKEDLENMLSDLDQQINLDVKAGRTYIIAMEMYMDLIKKPYSGSAKPLDNWLEIDEPPYKG